jgi:hypothetical protein
VDGARFGSDLNTPNPEDLTQFLAEKQQSPRYAMGFLE